MANETGLIRLGKYLPFAKSSFKGNWRNANYCAIDLETTGLDLGADEIVSIGVTHIRGGRIAAGENFYREVRPFGSPSVQSVRIHGLRASDLRSASPIIEVGPELIAEIEGEILVAHAAWMESAFLRRQISAYRFPKSKSMIDTAGLARALGYATEGREHEPSLEFLARRLHLPVFTPHNALGDALTTGVVFLALATELERSQMARGGEMLTLKRLLDTSNKYAQG